MMLTTLALAAAAASAGSVALPGEGHLQNPHWSPDGQWLAFERNNLANTVELWVVEVRQGMPSEPRPLRIPGTESAFGRGGTVVASPTWTATPSTMLLFEGSNPGGTMRIYYATPQSGAPSEFIPSSQLQGNLSSPDISPDGRRLAFISDASGNGDVYTWDLDKPEPRPIFSTGESEHAPRFDVTSSRLVFSRKHNGGEDIYRWDGGSTTPPVVGGNGDQTRPVWAGDSIVYFTSERGSGQWDIAVVPAAGGKRRIVARNVKLPVRAGPAISPDGAWVAYVSADPSQASSVMFAPLAGGDPVAVETGLVACGEPDLVERDGRIWLAFTALPAAEADWRGLHVMEVTGRF